MHRTPQAHASLAETLPALMGERSLSYRALAAQTQSLDHAGTGLSYSHIANLAAGRELPSRRALELLASAFEFPVSYFAEYRLAEPRRRTTRARHAALARGRGGWCRRHHRRNPSRSR